MTIFLKRVKSINVVIYLWSVGLCLSSTALSGIAVAKIATAQPNMTITVQKGLISADLVDVPLIGVLQSIEKEFRVKIHLLGDLTEPITLSVADVSLEKCLRLLTANHSLSVAYRPAAKPPEEGEAKQIDEIWILSRSSLPKKTISAPDLPAAVIPASGLLKNGVVSEEDTSGAPREGDQDSTIADQVLNNPNGEKSKQRQVVQNLVNIGNAESVLTMAKYLVNDDKELRHILINGISSIHNEQSTRVLGQVLQAESDPEIRKIAVSALADRQDDYVAKGFLEEALNDSNEEVKALANKLLTK